MKNEDEDDDEDEDEDERCAMNNQQSTINNQHSKPKPATSNIYQLTSIKRNNFK